MAGEVLGAGMPNFNAIGANINNGVYQISMVFTVVLVVLGFIGLIGFILYKRTFNIGVTVFDNTKGGIIIRDGFRAKYLQKRPGEFRFKIFDAKKYRFRYNQESLAPDDFYFDVMKNGKVRRRVFMTYDAEGQLIPARMTTIKSLIPRVDVKGQPILDSTGKPIMDAKEHIGATVKQVDVAWYYKELDKENEIFDARSAFDKWGWIVLAACLVLTLGAFMYTSYQFSKSAAAQAVVTTNIAKMITFMQNASVVVAS